MVSTESSSWSMMYINRYNLQQFSLDKTDGDLLTTSYTRLSEEKLYLDCCAACTKTKCNGLLRGHHLVRLNYTYSPKVRWTLHHQELLVEFSIGRTCSQTGEHCEPSQKHHHEDKVSGKLNDIKISISINAPL